LSKQRGQRKKPKERGKSSNKIMRDNGIMVFLWRFFCTWQPEKKLIKKIHPTHTKDFCFLNKRGKVAGFQ